MNKMLTVGTKFSGIGKIPILGGSRLNTLNSIIKAMFASNEQGFAYDPNDLTTLYQDAAGTIPVTSTGQPVGLVLDKSKGLVLRGEVLTNNWNLTGHADWTYADGVLTKVATTAGGGPSQMSTTSFVAGQLYKIEVEVSNLTGGSLGVMFIGGTNSNVLYNATNGTFTGYLYANAGNNYLRAVANSATVRGSIKIKSVKEVLGNHAYQTVSASRPILQRNATTGAYYLAFDGVDDFLRTNNIDFTATDKVSLFAGVRKLSDATVAMFLEYSQNVNTNIGGFNITAPNGTTATTYATNINGGSAAGRSAGGYVAPISNVLSLHLDTSKNNVVTGVMVRINGITPALSGTGATGTGNYGNYPLYIGRRGGTSLPFNGHLYSLIGISRLTTDSETIALEKSIAKNTGVTLNV